MNLLLRRREMISRQSDIPIPEPVLPEGYVRIEYVNRPGGTSEQRAFNTTGFTPNGTDPLEIRVGFKLIDTPGSNGAYPVVAGQNANDNTVGFGVCVAADGHQVGCFGGEQCYVTPNGGESVENIKYDAVARRTTTSIYYSDGINSNTVSLTPRNIARAFGVFGLKRYNQEAVVGSGSFYGNIYYIIIIEAGVVKVHLIPCKRTSDNRAGFYGLDGEFHSSLYYVAGPEVT